MNSNNGTPFHGADRELSNAHAKAIRDSNFRFATELCDTSYPLRLSPHFGGLWEAGVKSVHHLKRCIDLTLIFEEMSTLLCRIEACFNSRPIAPISDNLDDYYALTPDHF